MYKKYLSDIELLEIKHNVIESEKIKISQVNYFTIILGDIIQLIDQFIAQSMDQLLCLQRCKEIIIKFDQLRAEMMKKLRSTEKSQSFTPQNIQFLNLVFSYIRYILTRFGRIINYYDSLHTYHKRKQFTLLSSKQPPAIRKIQQQESMLNSGAESTDQSKKGSPFSTSSSNLNISLNNSESALGGTNNLRGSSKSLSSLLIKSPPTTINQQLNTTNISKNGNDSEIEFKNVTKYSKMLKDMKEVFKGLSDKEKSICIEKYMKGITQREERKQTVPLIVCRICSQKFYADKEKEHSQYCMEKINKIKDQQQYNLRFVELSNKLTECMLHIEKVSAFNTPRITYSNKSLVMSTPTMQRRNLGLSALSQAAGLLGPGAVGGNQNSLSNQPEDKPSSSTEVALTNNYLELIKKSKQDENRRKSCFYKAGGIGITPLTKHPIEEELKYDDAGSSSGENSSKSSGNSSDSSSSRSSSGSQNNEQNKVIGQQQEEQKLDPNTRIVVQTLDLSQPIPASNLLQRPSNVVPKLNMTKLQDPLVQPQQPKPQNPLLMYTARQPPQQVEQKQPTQSAAQSHRMSVQLPGQSLKNISSTLNTLRGLESTSGPLNQTDQQIVQIPAQSHRMMVQTPSTSVKNISSTLNTLRGLEMNKSNKSQLSFEKLNNQIVPTQTLDQLQDQDSQNQLTTEVIPQKPFEFIGGEEYKNNQNDHRAIIEEKKNQLEELKVQIESTSSIKYPPQAKSLVGHVIKPIFPIGLEKSSEIKPNQSKNVLNQFASIRDTLKKEIQPTMPMSARGSQAGMLGFFNQQKIEEKKKIQVESNEKPVQADKKEEIQEIINASKINEKQPQKSSNVITNFQLPTSPYLNSVSKKFESIKTSSKYLNEVLKPKPKNDTKTELSEQRVSLNRNIPIQNSPYIGIASQNLTKDQRQKQIAALKKHVQIKLQQGINEKQVYSRVSGSISNAFSLNIKNERKDAIKNMESLRQSVKLKKRANPLEKLVTKFICIESVENDKQITPQVKIDLTSPIQQSQTSIEETKSQQKAQNSIQKTLKIGSKLQSITEDQEDDPAQVQPQIKQSSQFQDLTIKITKSPPITENNSAQSPGIEFQRKFDDISSTLNRPPAFTGMSPIITFRPLNKIGSDSSQNTPLGTPNQRGALTSRDPHSSQSSNQMFEEQKSQEYLIALQNAKKELDILENLKTIALDIFNIMIPQSNRKNQIKILEQYQMQLKNIQNQGILGQKSAVTVNQFGQAIEDKLQSLKEIERLDRNYMKTLPSTEAHLRLEEEKINNSKLSRKMNLSLSREAPSSMTKKTNAKKASSIFFPPTFSPKKELFSQFQQNYNTSDQNSSHSSSSHHNTTSGQANLQQTYSPLSQSNIIEPMHFGNLEVQFQSVTPLIHPRGIGQFNDVSGTYSQLKLPGSLISLSQINSPKVDQRSSGFLPSHLQTLSHVSEKKSLQSIEEETPLKTDGHHYTNSQPKMDNNISQVQINPSSQPLMQSQGRIMQHHAQKQKSQFSNQTRPLRSAVSNQSHTVSLDNDSLSKDSISSEDNLDESDSYSSTSEINIDLKHTLTLDNGISLKSPYVTTKNKKSGNLVDCVSDHEANGSGSGDPSSSGSKISKNSLSTFSKAKKGLDNLKLLQDQHKQESKYDQSQSNSPKVQQLVDDLNEDFFNDDKTPMQRRSRNASFNLSLKRAHEPSPSKSRIIEKFQKSDLKRKDSHEYIECQSDIVVGANYDNEFGMDDFDLEERRTNSDIHEMFFVNELFEDDLKFERLLARLQIQECLQLEREHQLYVNTHSEEMKREVEGESQEGSEDEDDEQVLTMDKVRFSSCTNLPSHIESCSLENLEHQSQAQQSVSIHDFILLKTLNKGAYGKVILARKKNTDDFFAIKVLDKQKMVEKNVIEFIMNEKNILSQVSNDFIVRGVYTFQSKKYLYMVMEFMKGGDFATLLEDIEAFDEDTAQYYIAQIVLALEYLHKNGVIHRDLKPDNILIDSDGHIKLTDFGLSDAGILKLKENVKKMSNMQGDKQGINILSPGTQVRELELQQDIQKVLGTEANILKKATRELEDKKKSLDLQGINSDKTILERKTSSQDQKLNAPQPAVQSKKRMLGTADYMAPEIIQGEEHTYALDFWSLGVIVYEFLTGVLPFNDDEPEKIFKKIVSKQIKYPPVGREEGMMSPEAHDFIEQLLNLDPKKRLGSNGIQEIKNHPFFADIDWNLIMEMEPPFRPVGREQDTKYFTKAAYQEDDIIPIIKDQKSMGEQQQVKEFNKFDVINYDALQSINKKEAIKALARAERMNKRKPPQPKSKKSLFNETILQDIRMGLTSVEQLIENVDEEDLVTPKVGETRKPRREIQF